LGHVNRFGHLLHTKTGGSPLQFWLASVDGRVSAEIQDTRYSDTQIRRYLPLIWDGQTDGRTVLKI